VVWHDDRDGNWEIYYKRGATGSSGVEAEEDRTGAAPRLLSAGPNPSTGQVVIRYDLPSAASGVLEIFDPSGALVRRFMQELRPSGSHEIRWNGCDGAGRAVPSGVYMTRIEIDGRVMKGRVVLAR
jgi:flagellar hook assembly protein FlgD